MNKFTKKMTALVLTLALVMGVVIVPSYAVDVSSLVFDDTADAWEVTVKQGGVVIGPSDELNFENGDLDVHIKFRVPVEGDGVYDPFVKHGDTASIVIAEHFSLVSGDTTFDLMHGYQEGGVDKTIKVGSLTLKTVDTLGVKSTVAEIVFDGAPEVFDPTVTGDNWSDIICDFNADLQFDGFTSGSGDKKETIEIFKKEYELNIPAAPIVVTGDKTADRDGKTITWKVKVNATQTVDGIENNIDYAGYKFSDNLTSVGEYITASFKVSDDATDDYNTALPAVPDTESPLTYTFPDSTIGERYIFFQTTIKDSDYYSNDTKSIKNVAQIFDGVTEKKKMEATVTLDGKWIEKEGAIITQDLTAEPATARIEWTITANQLGDTLSNAVITDILPNGLTFVSAEAKHYVGEYGSGSWGPVFYTWLAKPADDKYALGTINTAVQLKIVTDVDGNIHDLGHTVVNFKNEATLSWDSYSSGVGSGQQGTGDIGLNPISKSVGSYNAAEHTIPWKVTVKKSNVSVDLSVVDLLVYGSSGFNINNIDGIEIKTPTSDYGEEKSAGVQIRSLTLTEMQALPNLKPEYNQKFKPGSFSPVGTSDLGYVVYTLKQGGKEVADLLLVTKGSGVGIDPSAGDQAFEFTTIVTNPEIYASNTSTPVYNTATLYSANTRVNEARANRSARSRMLVKDMLSRSDANDPENNNDKPGAADDEGYDYEEHTVVFRLHVNANDLKDFTGDITGTEGETVGKVTLTDTLPAGWEFVDVVLGSKFQIFEGGGNSNGTVTASGSPLSTFGFLDSDPTFTTVGTDKDRYGKVEFVFKELKKPYVILLKAKVNDEKVDEYFSKNQTLTLTNEAELKGEQWTNGVKATQKVEIESEILFKNYAKTSDGVVTWTIEYKPNNIGRANAEIIDELPEGLEVRLKSDGSLDIQGDNFRIYEMTLSSDGKYTLGAELTAVQVESYLKYNPSGRKMTFTIPDPTKAYRLTYMTDIFANIGTLTNEATLTSSTATQSGINGNYTVAAADASASMLRSGWIEITKEDGSGGPLVNAEFTLYTADGSTVVRAGKTDLNGKLALRGMPVGTYLLKETSPPAGYNQIQAAFSVVVTDSGGVKTSINNQAGANSNKITFKNYLSIDVGSLKVGKDVTGIQGDLTKEFSFTLEVTGIANGDYPYVGSGGKGDGLLTFSGGKTNFTLKDGEGIEIQNLPKDKAYTLTEDNYAGEGYSTIISGDGTGTVNRTGTIIAGDVKDITFTNNKDGWIEILKIDAKTNAPLPGAKFTLYDDSSPKNEVATGTTNGAGIVRFFDLIPGNTYYLKETQPPLGGYYNQYLDKNIGDVEHKIEVAVDGAVKIDNDVTNNITLKNHKNGDFGDLVIKKTLSGNNTDSTKDFEFTLTMPSLAIETFDYIGIGTPSGSFTFDAAGVYTFTLKGDQSIQIIYLPEGKSYTVVETDYSGDKYTTTPTDYSGTIVPDSIEIASFNNHKSKKVVPKTGTLMISKKVTGNAGDKSKKFTFTVTFSDKVQSFEYVGDLGNGTIKSGDKIQLAHGESITIVEIPDGVTYKIVEDDYTDDGYKHGATNSSGTIKEDVMAAATFMNDKHDEDLEEEGVLGDTDEKDPGKSGDEDGDVLGDDARLPKTGDDFMPAVWAAGLIASLLGIWYVLRRRSSFGEE